MSQSHRPGLHIYYCGREACLPGHSFGPAQRTHYLMHFVLRGQGTYQVNGQSFSIKEGMAFLIHPQEITFYEADQKRPWEYIWIAFDGEEAERLLRIYQSEKNPYLYHFSDISAVESYLKMLLETFPESNDFREKMLGYFYLVWSLIERPVQISSQSSELDYLNQAKKYIRYNYSYPVHIEELAHYLGIDRTYLYRIFVHYEHVSPKQYLTRYRLETAAEMLRNTTLTVTQTALSCGFHDSSSFCRQFTKWSGINPQNYRKQST